MITVGTVYYNHLSGVNPPKWASCYTSEWVDKLYRGIAKNYKYEFKFVCLTNESQSVFKEDILVRPLRIEHWNLTCLQLHAIKADRLVLMGLDTVITGNLEELFNYKGDLAIPRDPYRPESPCNAVVLSTTREDIAKHLALNDMAAIENFPHEYIDDLYPGQVHSYKVHMRGNRLNSYNIDNTRIVYFHGEPKPHTCTEEWIRDNWK